MPGDNQSRLIEVLTEWLKGLECSWVVIVKVLKKRSVGELRRANKLERNTASKVCALLGTVHYLTMDLTLLPAQERISAFYLCALAGQIYFPKVHVSCTEHGVLVAPPPLFSSLRPNLVGQVHMEHCFQQNISLPNLNRHLKMYCLLP